MSGDDNLLTSATVSGTHVNKLGQYMCPERTYKIRVAGGADDDDGYARTTWALYRNFDFATDYDDDTYYNPTCEAPCKVVAYNFFKTHGKVGLGSRTRRFL